MWVKICGNTNLQDAALAAELGADAVGFVFAASKRQVTIDQVAAITAYLPERVERVGVFDKQDAEQIADAALRAGLTAVQLHGGLNERLAEQLAAKFAGRVQIIHTLHWKIDEPESSASWLADQVAHIAQLGTADRVLIDSKVGTASGGTGVTFDWSAARSVFASAPASLRLIVAGGLRPDNVAEAIARLAPWGVDVSSGIELAPGKKDRKRLAQFIENAHTAARSKN